MTLGEKLKKLRLSKNLTMEELANELNKDDLNIGKSMISRWESDKTTPLNTYLKSYAKYFNISLDDLLEVNIDKNNSALPTHFDTPQDAMYFLLNQQTIMGFNGIDITKLPEDQQVEYANEVLKMMKLVSLQYKDK